MTRDTDSGDTLDRLKRREILAAAGGIAATGVTPTITTANRTPVTNADNEEGHAKLTQTLESPNGEIEVTVELIESEPRYSLVSGGETLIEPSTLGFEFRDADPFDGGFEVSDVRRQSEDSTWEPI